MKKLLIILAILAIAIDLSGQDYTPFPANNAFWSAMHCEPGPYERKSGVVKVGIFGDTVINSKLYHKLYLQRKYINGKFSCDTCGFAFTFDSASYFMSFREENRIIYFVPQQNAFEDPPGTEYPIFDFNLTDSGQTVKGYENIFIPFGSYGDPTPIPGFGVLQDIETLTVESIDAVRMSDGSLRRRINFKPLTYGLRESWIEGIGSTKGFGLSLNVTNSYNTMICFSHNGVNLESKEILSQQLCTYHPDSTLTFAGRCEYTSVSSTNDLPSNNNLSAFPNPVIQYFKITGINKGDKLSIYDIFGRVVHEEISDSEEFRIDQFEFPMGIYIFCVITTDDKIFRGKIIKL